MSSRDFPPFPGPLIVMVGLGDYRLQLTYFNISVGSISFLRQTIQTPSSDQSVSSILHDLFKTGSDNREETMRLDEAFKCSHDVAPVYRGRGTITSTRTSASTRTISTSTITGTYNYWHEYEYCTRMYTYYYYFVSVKLKVDSIV